MGGKILVEVLITAVYFIVAALGTLGFAFGLVFSRGSQGTISTPYFAPGIVLGSLYTVLFLLRCVRVYRVIKDIYKMFLPGVYYIVAYCAMVASFIGSVIVGSAGVCTRDENCYYTVNEWANRGIAIGLIVLHVFSFLFLGYLVVWNQEDELRITPAPLPQSKTSTQPPPRLLALRLARPPDNSDMESGVIKFEPKPKPTPTPKPKPDLKPAQPPKPKPPLISRGSTSTFNVDVTNNDKHDDKSSDAQNHPREMYRKQGRKHSFDLHTHKRYLTKRKSDLGPRPCPPNERRNTPPNKHGDPIKREPTLPQVVIRKEYDDGTNSSTGTEPEDKKQQSEIVIKQLNDQVERLKHELDQKNAKKNKKKRDKKEKKEKVAVRKHDSTFSLSQVQHEDSFVIPDPPSYDHAVTLNAQDLPVDSPTPYWIPPPPPRDHPSFNPRPSKMYLGTDLPETEINVVQPSSFK